MVLKKICVLVLWSKVATALEWLDPTETTTFSQIFLTILISYRDIPVCACLKCEWFKGRALTRQYRQGGAAFCKDYLQYY